MLPQALQIVLAASASGFTPTVFDKFLLLMMGAILTSGRRTVSHILVTVGAFATGHPGKKVYGKGKHRDAKRSTKSFMAFLWGHKWVVLAILVTLPGTTVGFTATPRCMPRHPRRSAKTKGRPRVVGRKLPTPQEVVAKTKKRKRLTVSWYGGQSRLVEVVTGTGLWSALSERERQEVRPTWVGKETLTFSDVFIAVRSSP